MPACPFPGYHRLRLLPPEKQFLSIRKLVKMLVAAGKANLKAAVILISLSIIFVCSTQQNKRGIRGFKLPSKWRSCTDSRTAGDWARQLSSRKEASR